MSQQALSADTEVVLLMCGRFGGERQEPFQPLSAREYGEFARWLKARSLRPADLLSDSGREHLFNVHEAKLEGKRVNFLLGRGTALALALERWSRGGLWVISRGDPEFPKRLKHHLKHAAPPLIYGAGDKSLLESGGLAIIGSRDATEAALEFTRAVASKCAKEGLAVVSGGARGVDAAAMQGATEAGGKSIGILASDLLKMSVNRQNRIGLQEGKLVLISPFYPEAGFNAGNAMARNKYIYTLADQALVIDSALGSGGTWEGALEDLQKQWVPLYVRTPGSGPGNAELVKRGGIAFALAKEATETLGEFFIRTAPATRAAIELSQESLLLPRAADIPEKEISIPSAASCVAAPEMGTITSYPTPPGSNLVDLHVSEPFPPVVASGQAASSMDLFGDFLAKLTQVLVVGPKTEADVAMLLRIEKAQAKVWLKKAVESGSVGKLKNPVRYGLVRQQNLL